MFLDEMKFGNRNKAYFEKVKQIYMDIELNNKANDFIENDIIDIVLYFDPKKPEFSIFEEGLKEKQLEFSMFLIIALSKNYCLYSRKMCQQLKNHVGATRLLYQSLQGIVDQCKHYYLQD